MSVPRCFFFARHNHTSADCVEKNWFNKACIARGWAALLQTDGFVSFVQFKLWLCIKNSLRRRIARRSRCGCLCMQSCACVCARHEVRSSAQISRPPRVEI